MNIPWAYLKQLADTSIWISDLCFSFPIMQYIIFASGNDYKVWSDAFLIFDLHFEDMQD